MFRRCKTTGCRNISISRGNWFPSPSKRQWHSGADPVDAHRSITIFIRCGFLFLVASFSLIFLKIISSSTSGALRISSRELYRGLSEPMLFFASFMTTIWQTILFIYYFPNLNRAARAFRCFRYFLTRYRIFLYLHRSRHSEPLKLDYMMRLMSVVRFVMHISVRKFNVPVDRKCELCQGKLGDRTLVRHGRLLIQPGWSRAR